MAVNSPQTRVVIKGDKAEAEKMLPTAFHYRNIVKNAMSFQGLKQYRQSFINKENGAEIHVFSCFGVDTIKVITRKSTSESVIEELSNGTSIIEVQFIDITGNDNFASVANSQIAGWNAMKDFGYYCINTYFDYIRSSIRNYCEHHNDEFQANAGLLLCIGAVVSGDTAALGGVYDCDDYVDANMQYYIDWADVVYPEYITACNKAIQLWNIAKSISLNLPSVLRCKFTGGFYPQKEISTAIAISDGYAWWVNCCELNAEIILPQYTPNKIGVLNASALLSDYVQDIYDNLNPECSPEYSAEFTTTTGFLRLSFKFKGVMCPNNQFCLLITDCDYYINSTYFQTGKIYGITIQAEMNGQVIYNSDSYIKNRIMKITLPDYAPEAAVELKIKMKGRAMVFPIYFGGKTSTYYWADFTDFNSWAGMFFFWDCYRTLIGNQIEACPGIHGFRWFAGLYDDHPISTGIDKFPIIPSNQNVSVLNEINDYVNDNYDYVSDPARYDFWKIMTDSDTGGDCEDFAITKIHLLLLKGWSINDLFLEGGFHYEYDDVTGELLSITGHMWAVARIGHNEYVLDNGEVSLNLTSRSAMYDEYGSEVLYQLSGLLWKNGDVYHEGYAVPYPHEDFDLNFATVNLKIIRHFDGYNIEA